jgi:predicted TPR repeat methyltransferase
VARESFGILVAFQRLDAARALGAWLETRNPADAIRAHELRVLVEPGIDKAPAAYVEALFDGFAERFDHQLVDMLGYEAPALLADLVANHRERFERILDLGCGTGLAGPHLARFGGRLTGVDLSSAMLAKAAERGGYDALVQSEAVDFLEEHPGAFDLIVSADVLIYFGDLAPLFSAAAAALPRGGLLAVSTELGQDGWTLLPSARYAHGDAYVRASAPGFRIVERQEIPLRREGADVTAGCLYVLEKL